MMSKYIRTSSVSGWWILGEPQFLH